MLCEIKGSRMNATLELILNVMIKQTLVFVNNNVISE